MITRPNALNFGDSLAMLSLSSRSSQYFQHRVARARFFLESSGYQTIEMNFPANLNRKQWIEHRVSSIHDAFSDKSIKGIICTIGGLSANEIVDKIDYDLIAQNPKFFCGYSDITILHLAIHKFSRLQTFYGPMAMTQFAEFPSPFPHTIEYFNKAASSKSDIGEIIPSRKWTDEILSWGESDTTRSRRTKKNPGHVWINPGKGRGLAIGGCLPSLLQLTGTKFDFETDQKVLFLETPEGNSFDSPTPVSVIDSQLTDLKLKGKFDSLQGLLIGRPVGFTNEEMDQFLEMINDHFSGEHFPVCANLDFGHSDPIITIPYSSKVRMDSYANSILIYR